MIKNNKFWDECTDGSLRQKIAEFIDKNPAVSHLKDKAYYDFEDALVALIYDNREMISKEVDLEYQREDFLTQAKEEFGDDVEEAVKVLPIDVIDNMINHWQEALDDLQYKQLFRFWQAINDFGNLLCHGCHKIKPPCTHPLWGLSFQSVFHHWTGKRKPHATSQHEACNCHRCLSGA